MTNSAVPGLDATGVNTNFRIYWDGDLCSETFNYLNGKTYPKDEIIDSMIEHLDSLKVVSTYIGYPFIYPYGLIIVLGGLSLEIDE